MSDYMRIWKLRKAALENMLGPADDRVMTSPMPIYLGGFADVMCFSEFLPGKTYVTGGLVGLGSQKPIASGPFELMICTPEESGWAANLISRLARYSHDAVLSAGDTMDAAPAMPKGSTLAALLFVEPDLDFSGFIVDGEAAHLLLCLGITADELRYKQEHGSDALLDRLKEGQVYPYTDVRRKSAV
jgi:hypothetical protein